MIFKYGRILALLCCFPLIAKKSTEITEPINSSLAEKITFSQGHVASLTRAGASGYHAAKDAVLLVKSLAQSGDELQKTVAQLNDQTVAQKFFGTAETEWRTHVIEERKRALAADYLKDVLFLNVKGAKRVEYKDIQSFEFDLWRLYIEEAVVMFDPLNSLKAQAELSALLGLLTTVAEKLAAQHEEKKAAKEYSYSVSRDAFIQAIKEEASLKAETGIRKVYDQLTIKEVLESYFPTLPAATFTVTSDVNENTIHSTDAQGASKSFKRTYAAFKEKLLPDLVDADGLIKNEKQKEEAPQKEVAPAQDTEKDKLDGDHLSIGDMKKLVQKVIAPAPASFEIDAEDLEDVTVHCLESSSKISFLEDLQLDLQCKSIVADLQKTPAATAIIPICCDGHWIACVVFRHKDGAMFEIADSKNQDRQQDPAILKLARAIDESFKKKDGKDDKITSVDFKADASGKDDKKDDKDKEEKADYDAPLAKFPLDQLPKIEEFFGGKIPNSILVHLHQMKAAAQETKSPIFGTKIKNCLILHGPAGTGKSTLAQVMARMADWDILFISGGAFRNAYQGSSKAIMDALFNEAKSKNKPCVIIIDEIDGTTSKVEPHSSTMEDARAIKVLLTTLDQNRFNPNLFVICTTNYPEKIEPAILRRFTCIEVPLPNYAAREQILRHYLDRNGIEINDTDANAVSTNFFDALVAATNGLSGDALEDLVSMAIHQAKLGLAPEEDVGMGFWFKGIDSGKSAYLNIIGLLENPYVPFVYILGGYAHSEFDKHLYSQYKVKQKTRSDIEAREEANDPNNKVFKQSWRQKAKTALLSALGSFWHGIFTQVGGDVYNSKIKPPALNVWNKIASAAPPAAAA